MARAADPNRIPAAHLCAATLATNGGGGRNERHPAGPGDRPASPPMTGQHRMPEAIWPTVEDARLLENDDDHFHDECGVFGVWNVPDAAAVTTLGLHALQHRGQASAGIVAFDGEKFHTHR